MPNPDFYVRKSGKKKERKTQIKMGESHREMDGRRERQSEASSRFALFTELVCSLSAYKQITDTGLKPMRHIIIHAAACQHRTETAKYNIVPQRPD